MVDATLNADHCLERLDLLRVYKYVISGLTGGVLDHNIPVRLTCPNMTPMITTTTVACLSKVLAWLQLC